MHAQTLPTDSASFPSSPTSGSFTPTSYRYSGTTANNFRWQFFNTQTDKWIDLITLANFNNYIGTATQAAITKGGDSTLSKPKNLYDVPNKQTARKNLGTIDSATFFNPAYVDTSGASLKYLSVWFDTMAKKYQLVNNNNRAAAYQKFINRDTVKIGFFGTSIIYGLNTSGALGPGVMYGPGGPNRSTFNPPDYADTLFKRGGVPVKVMNYGRGGSEALKDFYRWDTVSTQDVVGMEFGINESTGSTTIDYKLGLYKQVINLLNKGTFVFFCLPTKTNLDPINNASKQYLISPIMQEVANTFNIPIYNAWENVTSGYGRILQSDNIHLTDLGYQRYGEGLAAFILRGETQQIYSPGTKALPEYVFNSRRPITSNGLTSSGRIVNFSVNTFDYSAFYLTAPADVYSTIINTTTNPAYIRWVFNETTVLDTVTGNGSLKTKKLITLGAGWHFFSVRNIGAGSWGIDNIDFRSIIADNSLSPKKLEAIAGNSILGRSGTGVGDVVAITSTSNNTLPQRVGGVITWGAVNLATMVSGVMPVANGGTGQSVFTNGQLLIGNTTGSTLTKATLTGSAATGLTITNGAGSITLSNDTTILRTSLNSFSKAQADARYGKLGSSNTFTGQQTFLTSGNSTVINGTAIGMYESDFTIKRPRVFFSDNNTSRILNLYAPDALTTSVRNQKFQDKDGDIALTSDLIDYVVNTTTIGLSSATLNSTYPDVSIGYRVICPSITLGGAIYTKATEAGSSDVWLLISAPVAP